MRVFLTCHKKVPLRSGLCGSLGGVVVELDSLILSISPTPGNFNRLSHRGNMSAGKYGVLRVTQLQRQTVCGCTGNCLERYTQGCHFFKQPSTGGKIENLE